MKKSKEDERWSVVGLAMDLGLVLVLPLLAGVAIGRWIDWQLDTLPWFTLVLIGVGAIVGFMAMIWKVKNVVD
jgi:F0F1-type ATP synthase assembly protein I